MNKVRRKKLSELMADIISIREQLEELRDYEQCSYDNIPESLQGTERGERSLAAIEAMESVISYLEDCEANFDDLED